VGPHVRLGPGRVAKTLPQTGQGHRVDQSTALAEAPVHPFVLIGEDAATPAACEDPALGVEGADLEHEGGEVLGEGGGVVEVGRGGGDAGDPVVDAPGKRVTGPGFAEGGEPRGGDRGGVGDSRRGLDLLPHVLQLGVRVVAEEGESGDQLVTDAEERVVRAVRGTRPYRQLPPAGELGGYQRGHLLLGDDELTGVHE
jgi:hypothetical protein